MFIILSFLGSFTQSLMCKTEIHAGSLRLSIDRSRAQEPSYGVKGSSIGSLRTLGVQFPTNCRVLLPELPLLWVK